MKYSEILQEMREAPRWQGPPSFEQWLLGKGVTLHRHKVRNLWWAAVPEGWVETAGGGCDQCYRDHLDQIARRGEERLRESLAEQHAMCLEGDRQPHLDVGAADHRSQVLAAFDDPHLIRELGKPAGTGSL